MHLLLEATCSILFSVETGAAIKEPAINVLFKKIFFASQSLGENRESASYITEVKKKKKKAWKSLILGSLLFFLVKYNR